MARKLPWEKSRDAKAQPSARPSPSHVLDSPRAHPSSTSHAASSPSRRIIRPRSPSTSPPPEPPAQEFMTSGDERYRMVEDELLYTAQRFTMHLHRAEYVRLKEQTRSRNGATIRAMERPVVGVLDGPSAQRQRAVRVRDRQRSVVGGDVSEEPWVGTSLYGLMERRRRGEGALGRWAGSRAEVRTRAAAGCASRAGGCVAQEGSREARDSDGERAGCDDDGDGDDDPFGVQRRRARRVQSRETMRRSEGRGREEPTRAPDTIPSFL
ncbi:hypothetical protein E4U42_002150 [Claviceps africana]|uniref:Uncharacterized protein n=1 Tax=Claviceps africana TaxID=83212 RepID=A0A8K0NMG9_9HYPO|nr:hypothetical protein E4U42_002150 [Claviceps africana]